MINRFNLVLLFVCCRIFAFNCDYSKEEAIIDLYNFRFDSCIKTLDKLLDECPNDPLVPFLNVSANWQKELFHGNVYKSYEVIYKGIKKLAPHYQDMIERYPNDQRYNLFLGSLYGLKARIDLAQSDWMALVVSGVKGFSYINEARHKDLNLNDVYMPIGTLEYFLCKSSSALQIMGGLFGLSSDCSEAISKLERASENGELSWVETRNVLSHIYLYIERDYSRALYTTSSLVKNFPEHPFFSYLHAETLVRLGMYSEFNSIKGRLETFISDGPINQRIECQDKFNYIESLIHFQFNRYKLAAEKSSEVIDGYDNEFKWILGYAYFIRAKSRDALGKRKLAISDYQMAIKYLDRYPEQIEASQYIKNPFVGK